MVGVSASVNLLLHHEVQVPAHPGWSQKKGRKTVVVVVVVQRFIMSCSSLQRSGMARVNEGSHSFTCHLHIYPQAE